MVSKYSQPREDSKLAFLGQFECLSELETRNFDSGSPSPTFEGGKGSRGDKSEFDLLLKPVAQGSANSLFYEDFKNNAKGPSISKKGDPGNRAGQFIPFNNTFGKGNFSLKKFKEGSNDSLKPSDIILNSIEVNGRPQKTFAYDDRKLSFSVPRKGEELVETIKSLSGISPLKLSGKKNRWENTVKLDHLVSSNEENKMSRSVEYSLTDKIETKKASKSKSLVK